MFPLSSDGKKNNPENNISDIIQRPTLDNIHKSIAYDK